MGSFTGLWGPKSDSQQPLTLDEFVNARRKLQPKTEADYIESEVDKVRGTERWKEGGQRLRENLESGARRNAKEAFAGYQRGVADETSRLVNDYNVYKTGWKTKRDELLNQTFVERHPTVATALDRRSSDRLRRPDAQGVWPDRQKSR